MRQFHFFRLPITDLSIQQCWWEHVPRTMPSGVHRTTVAYNMMATLDGLPAPAPEEYLKRSIMSTVRDPDIEIFLVTKLPLFVAARLQWDGHFLAPSMVEGNKLPFTEVGL